MKKLRTAVIGVGYLGKFHAEKYANLPNSELVAVVDANLANGKVIAEKNGCEALTQYQDLYDRVDAVSIAAPTVYHFQIAKDCLEHGIHVLIEKPITVTVAEDELDLHSLAVWCRDGNLALESEVSAGVQIQLELGHLCL